MLAAIYSQSLTLSTGQRNAPCFFVFAMHSSAAVCQHPRTCMSDSPHELLARSSVLSCSSVAPACCWSWLLHEYLMTLGFRVAEALSLSVYPIGVVCPLKTTILIPYRKACPFSVQSWVRAVKSWNRLEPLSGQLLMNETNRLMLIHTGPHFGLHSLNAFCVASFLDRWLA